MERSLTIACMAALASFGLLSQGSRANDTPVRTAIYISADSAAPTVNVAQVVVPAPVAYRPYRAYYRPYAYRPYAAPYRPNRAYYGYMGPYAPVRPYGYGGYYAPPYARSYTGYRGYYW
jgi:hypothetical protein